MFSGNGGIRTSNRTPMNQWQTTKGNKSSQRLYLFAERNVFWLVVANNHRVELRLNSPTVSLIESNVRSHWMSLNLTKNTL